MEEAKPEVPTTDVEAVVLTFPELHEQAKTFYSPEIVNSVVRNTQLGHTLKDCAALVNIDASILRRWYRDNYFGFATAIDNVNAKNKRLHMSRIQSKTAKKEHVNASQWWLERKNKDEFSKEISIVMNHQVKDGSMEITRSIILKYIKDPDMAKLAFKDAADMFIDLKVDDMPGRIAHAKQ